MRDVDISDFENSSLVSESVIYDRWMDMPNCIWAGTFGF